MEVLSAVNHKESILRVLTQVPIATTKQLAKLNQSLDPQKKASKILRELEKEKMVGWRYHGREKIWYLSKRGRKLQQVTPTRFPTDLDHALSVIDLYFNLNPRYWLYEPVERFEHLGKPYVWNPDCVFVYQKKVYACELQRTKLTAKRWAGKWKAYNLYFNRDYFHSAPFQKWSPKLIYPQFLVLSNQKPEIVKSGWEIGDRELIVCREFKKAGTMTHDT